MPQRALSDKHGCARRERCWAEQSLAKVERFLKIARLSGHRTQLARAQEFSAVATLIECCRQSFARLGRCVGTRTLPAFVDERVLCGISRQRPRVPTRSLAVAIGAIPLGAHLPRIDRIFGSLGEHTRGSVKTRFFRPGRFRAISISAICQTLTFTGWVSSLDGGRKQR